MDITAYRIPVCLRTATLVGQLVLGLAAGFGPAAVMEGSSVMSTDLARSLLQAHQSPRVRTMLGMHAGDDVGGAALGRTHKLHAIFHDKVKAEHAKDVLIKSGAFPSERLFLIEVPMLVDTESPGNHSRPKMTHILAKSVTGAVVGAGVALGGALAGAAGLFLFELEWPASNPLRALSITATAGALAGILVTRTLSRIAPPETGVSRGARREGKWVLIAHATTDQEARLAEELLASAKFPGSLRVRRRGPQPTVVGRTNAEGDSEHAA